jgi:AAA+ ATPase superfamily predicted ATPase
MIEWLKDLIEAITGRKAKKFLKKINEGTWIVWGNYAVPIEDVLTGKQRLVYGAHILTLEELGLKTTWGN